MSAASFPTEAVAIAGGLTTIVPTIERTDRDVAAEVLAAVKADVHPGVLGVDGYSHLMACIEHVGRRYGVQS